ncbi:MAG TPA: hypothetical protein VMJ10_02325 [Kofleriaceae bacterium]|nr:hypothetical protein [Kofleriaceae bacterium]
MSWRFAIAAAGVAVGCAEAGSSNQVPDAASRTDAAREMTPIDARAPMDAPAATCTTTVTCTTATVLPGIGGDEDGASSSSASGYQAAWYSIRLSETDSGPFADPMSIETTLTSPSGAMFDLLVYVNTGSDQLDCTTPTGTVTTNGASEASNIEWGETGTFANDADDSRTVSIQISPHVGASCSPGETWSLSILTGFD